MSGCPSYRSVRVPVGALTLTLAGLAAAGVTIVATQSVRGIPSVESPSTSNPYAVSPPYAIDADGSASGGSASGGIAGGVQFFSSFEPPCDTTLNGNGYIGGGGSGAPQNCDWHTSTGAQPGYTEPHIDDVNPFTMAQHLRFQHDPNMPVGTPPFPLDADAGVRNWAFSDDIVPTPPTGGVQHLSMKIMITLPGAAVMENSVVIQPQAPSEGFLTTQMLLHSDGNVWARDATQYNDTGVAWVPNEYRQLDICLDNPNNRIRYFYDGVLVWSTGFGEGGEGGGILAGTIIEHVLIRYEGNVNDGTILDVDDVTIEVDNCPEPSGACCVAEDDCQIQTEPDCIALGGLYQGIGAACPGVCNAALACVGTEGDCFSPNGTPGCDQPDPGSFPLPAPGCCALVCSTGGFEICCLEGFGWQQLCSDFAAGICPRVNCSQPEQNCQQMDLSDTTGPAISATGPNHTPDILASQIADNFTPAADGSINSVCFYGTYLTDNTGPPPIPSDGFTITYYDCVAGVPGNVIASYTQGASLVVTRLDTNLNLSGEFDPIFEYTATHADTPVLSAGTPYFVEIVNTVGPATPAQTWFWQTSNTQLGDGAAFLKPDGAAYARHFRFDEDLSFCFNLELGDANDLCPFPDPVPCDLDVAGADVVEPETCGQDPDQNLGCSGLGAGDPPAGYTDIQALSLDPSTPTVISGEAWADGNTRDVDWYRFPASSTPDLLGNQDGFVFVCLSAASEIPIGAVVGTIAAANDCGGIATGVFSAVGFECASTFDVATQIPVSGGGGNDLGTIIVRTYDGVEVFNGYPCAPPCPWDCEATPDGSVGINDFLDLLAQWTQVGSSCDFDGTGVGINAFLDLLANWGPCPADTVFGHDYRLEAAIVDDPAECNP